MLILSVVFKRLVLKKKGAVLKCSCYCYINVILLVNPLLTTVIKQLQNEGVGISRFIQ